MSTPIIPHPRADANHRLPQILKRAGKEAAHAPSRVFDLFLAGAVQIGIPDLRPRFERISLAGLLAVGALAPCKCFAAGRPSPETESASAGHLDCRRAEAAKGRRNPKRKDILTDVLSFWRPREDLNLRPRA